MRDELDAEEIFPSRSEVNPDTSRLGGLETAKFEPLEQSYNCGTDDSSSDEIGIKSAQEMITDLAREDTFDFTLIGTSGRKFPDVEEEAVRSTTAVASRGIDCMPGASDTSFPPTWSQRILSAQGWRMTTVEEAEDEQEPILFWQ